MRWAILYAVLFLFIHCRLILNIHFSETFLYATYFFHVEAMILIKNTYVWFAYRCLVFQSQLISELIKEDVTSADSGFYRCRLGLGGVSSRILVTVIDS